MRNPREKIYLIFMSQNATEASESITMYVDAYFTRLIFQMNLFSYTFFMYWVLCNARGNY